MKNGRNLIPIKIGRYTASAFYLPGRYLRKGARHTIFLINIRDFQTKFIQPVNIDYTS